MHRGRAGDETLNKWLIPTIHRPYKHIIFLSYIFIIIG